MLMFINFLLIIQNAKPGSKLFQLKQKQAKEKVAWRAEAH